VIPGFTFARVDLGYNSGMSEAGTERGAEAAGDVNSWIARVLLLVAVGVTAYLLFGAWQGGPIAGCGAEGGCNEVLQSHWSRWWKIPVAMPALVAYISLLLLSLQRPGARGGWRDGAMVALCVMIFGAAAWFVGLQVFVINSTCVLCRAVLTHLCVFCITAHGCAVWSAWIMRPEVRAAAAWRGIGAGVLGLMLLCGGQLVLPSPTALWEVGGGPNAVVLPAGEGQGRRIAMYKGHLELDLGTVPVIGSPEAAHVAVVLFDVTCGHCRELHRQLATARARYGKDLAIVALPMPLDARCNPAVSKVGGNVNSCEYARLALAVWRADRTKYEEFVGYMFETPLLPGPEGVALAERRAGILVGEAQVQAALKDAWVEEQLRVDVELYRANNKVKGSTAMPQMVLGDVFMQGAPDAEELQRQMAAFVGRQ
jgi:protein-disulfide isomerase